MSIIRLYWFKEVVPARIAAGPQPITSKGKRMNLPNYTDYTLNQLRDCEKNIDKIRFPHRYEIITKEIALRKVAGEIETEPSFEEFFATGVPTWVGVGAWWRFFWRSTLVTGILIGLFFPFANYLWFTMSFAPWMLPVVKTVFTVAIIPIVGITAMMQTLAKRYHGYRIYIREVDESMKKDDGYPSASTQHQ